MFHIYQLYNVKMINSCLYVILVYKYILHQICLMHRRKQLIMDSSKKIEHSVFRRQPILCIYLENHVLFNLALC